MVLAAHAEGVTEMKSNPSSESENPVLHNFGHGEMHETSGQRTHFTIGRDSNTSLLQQGALRMNRCTGLWAGL